MNNNEFERLEKVLSEILIELQIQNKLRAVQLTRELLHNAPLSLALNDKARDALYEDMSNILKGYGLKEMKNDV